MLVNTPALCKHLCPMPCVLTRVFTQDRSPIKEITLSCSCQVSCSLRRLELQVSRACLSLTVTAAREHNAPQDDSKRLWVFKSVEEGDSQTLQVTTVLRRILLVSDASALSGLGRSHQDEHCTEQS